MVAAHLRQHDHHGLGAAAHAWPGPVDQKSDLGEIVFMIDGSRAVDPSLDPPCRELGYRISPDETKASAISSARGLYRKSPVSGATRGKALLPLVTRGAVTGKIDTPREDSVER